MKIFLTGATGFIGSHVARALLRNGHQVHALVRRGSDTARIADICGELKVVEGDLFSLENVVGSLRQLRPELCLHLAWYAEPGKYLDSQENLSMLASSLRLARELHEVGCRRIVATGTCFEYETDYGYLSETTPTQPRSLYGASKLAFSLVLQQFGALTNMSVAWIRFFYQYGPFEDRRRLVPHVIHALLKGEDLKVTAGEQIRDFLHVEDVATAVAAVAESDLEGVVNVGSGEPVSVRTLVLQIGKILGSEDRIQLGALPYGQRDPMFICADNRRLRERTGWDRKYDLNSGIHHTIEWWKKFLK